LGVAGSPTIGGWAGLFAEAERVDRDAADLGGIEPEDLAGGHHWPSWWQTGQTRRAARRSQRSCVRAVASWNPQVGQDATHIRCSRCSAGSGGDGAVVAGWLVVVVG
jgi:hypothetical protein